MKRRDFIKSLLGTAASITTAGMFIRTAEEVKQEEPAVEKTSHSTNFGTWAFYPGTSVMITAYSDGTAGYYPR